MRPNTLPLDMILATHVGINVMTFSSNNEGKFSYSKNNQFNKISKSFVIFFGKLFTGHASSKLGSFDDFSNVIGPTVVIASNRYITGFWIFFLIHSQLERNPRLWPKRERSILGWNLRTFRAAFACSTDCVISAA